MHLFKCTDVYVFSLKATYHLSFEMEEPFSTKIEEIVESK